MNYDAAILSIIKMDDAATEINKLLDKLKYIIKKSII